MMSCRAKETKSNARTVYVRDSKIYTNAMICDNGSECGVL